jgi:PDZ domain
MRVFVLVISWLLFVSSSALAQVTPEAAKWLELALKRQGGQRITNAKVINWSWTAIWLEKGKAFGSSYSTQNLDFERQRGWLESSLGRDLWRTNRFDKRGGQAWDWNTPDLLPKAVKETEWRDEQVNMTMFQFGLRFGSKRDKAVVLGQKTLQGIKGTLLEVTTLGMKHQLLIRKDGLLLGEVEADGTQFLYQDFSDFVGVILPRFVRVYNAKNELIELQVLHSLTIQNRLPDSAFELRPRAACHDDLDFWAYPSQLETAKGLRITLWESSSLGIAGLRNGDEIRRVNGQALNNLVVHEALAKLQGQSGKLQLEVMRDKKVVRLEIDRPKPSC